jgi:isoleucyl-tRNA synthetase
LDEASREPLARVGILPLDTELMSEVCIVSAFSAAFAPAPPDAFTLPDLPGIAVAVDTAVGEKCARCWKILPDVGTHAHPGVCARCDAALG